jgi:hypothetical protein
MIKVNIDWQGKKGLDNLIRYIENNLVYAEAQEEVRILGHHTADYMKNIIKESGYNLDKLANSILAETLSTTGGVEVGIGRIASFPKGKNGQTYWEAFNDGFKPGAMNTLICPGSFEDGRPDASKSGGKWTEHAGYIGGNYTFFDNNQNKKPIAPLDFVGKAIRNLDQELREMMEKWGTKFIGGAQEASK